jgi:hypothetical protein
MKSQQSLLFLVEILYGPNLEILLRSKEEHLFLLSRGYFILPFDEERRNRYAAIENLEADKRRVLTNANYMRNIRSNWVKMSFKPLSAIGKYIVEGRTQELVKLLGMVLPGGVVEEDYIRTKIHQYQPLFDRPSSPNIIRIPFEASEFFTLRNLYQLTDKEIIKIIGVRPIFSSRVELIDNVRKLWCFPGFFESIDRRSVNSETTTLTEVTDKQTLMIGYGKLDNYRCYEADELHLSFYLGDDKKVHFRKPEGKDCFELDQILNLNSLITDLFTRGVGNMEHLSGLHNHIERGIVDYRQMSSKMREIYRREANLDKSSKDKLRVWLITLFQAGMYMRRWSGNSDSYPHSENESRVGPDPSKSDETTPFGTAMGKLIEISKEFSVELKTIVDNLVVVEYRDDGSEYSLAEGNLIKFYQSAANGIKCIRQASRPLILSAAYYLTIFFNHQISEFRPESLVSIS